MHPQVCLKAKFLEKIKFPKFETKNALFHYFWVVILKYFCHISNQHTRICLTAKVQKKIKTLKFGTKNVLLGYFWVRLLQNYCHV